MDEQYTFPFDTCEKVNHNSHVAQPFSTVVNFITCLVIGVFLLQAKSWGSFVVLMNFLLFELFHMYSHSQHIPGSIQINVLHTLAYAVNFSILYLFSTVTKRSFSKWFMLALGIIIAADIYALIHLSIVYYLATQSLFLLSTFFYFYPSLPKMIQSIVFPLVGAIGLIIVLFINEKENCRRMLEYNSDFPYHTIIEIAGLLFFYLLCSRLYRL